MVYTANMDPEHEEHEGDGAGQVPAPLPGPETPAPAPPPEKPEPRKAFRIGGRESRPDRARRLVLTRRLLKTKQLLDVILQHIRNGGSLLDLCRTWGVRYSDFISWIRADEARSNLYNEAMKDRSEWTDEMILSEIRLRIELDPRKLYNADGSRKRVHQLDADTARMIDEVKKDGTIKFMGKKEALELGARNRQLLTDKVKLGADSSLEDLLARSYADPVKPKEAPTT